MEVNHLRLIKKALTSPCKFHVSALGIDNQGSMLFISRNTPGFNRHHGGLHAEADLIKRYGSKIKTIIICRTNEKGKLLPIHPCARCQKAADKLGIKIIPLLDIL